MGLGLGCRGFLGDMAHQMETAAEAVVTLANHRMAETDPELGANLMIFFFRDWAELPQVPNLDRLILALSDKQVPSQSDGAHQREQGAQRREYP